MDRFEVPVDRVTPPVCLAVAPRLFDSVQVSFESVFGVGDGTRGWALHARAHVGRNVRLHFLDCSRIARSLVILRIILGIPLAVGQPVEHFAGRFPANPSVGSQIPHRVTGRV
jgi:hypothetical protein